MIDIQYIHNGYRRWNISRRYDIHRAYVSLLNTNLNGIDYSDAYNKVSPVVIFWDEISDYPWVGVTVGDEIREYDTGGIKWGYLALSIRVYVQEEEHGDTLNQFLEDIENIVEIAQSIKYNDAGSSTLETLVQSITTDQGVLAPLGVGEINFLIKYPLPSNICCGPTTPYPCP